MSFGGRIPIRIHPLFWLMAGAIGVLYSGDGDINHILIWIVVIFISVLVHEFGHALTGLAFGQSVSIDLIALGGLTQRQGPPLSLFKEFLIVLNGPMAGFCLFIVCYALFSIYHDPTSLMTYALGAAVNVNFFWTLVNLLPIQPLDGGKLLVIFMEALFGLRGVKIGYFIGVLLASALGLFYFAIGAMLPGAILLMLAFESYRTWQGSLVMTDKDRDSHLLDLLKSAENLLTMGKIDQAEHLLKQIRSEVKAGFLFLATTQLLGQIAAKKGDFHQAYLLLLSIEKHLSDDDLVLLHQLAFSNRQWKHAIAVGDRVHQGLPSYDTALLNALSHAVLGEVEPAIGWLRCAIEEGLPNVKRVVMQTEFDPIRDNPDFKHFVATL